MKNTKASGIFKKIFLAPILALLILAAFITLSCSGLSQTDILSYNAPESKTLYEADVFYNIVILVNLSDKNFYSSDYSTIDKAFNDTSDANVKSLREYFREESKYRKNKNGALNPLDVISVYMFCDSNTTSQAFKDMDKEDTNNTKSDQISFVNRALSGKIYWDINKKNEFNGDLDANDDGLIDSVTLYVPLSITNADANTAAWPHTILGNSAFNHTFKNLKYDRFVVSSYTIGGTSAQVGVLCHEMLHNIGNDAPNNGVQDLYHYYDEKDPGFYNLTPVGNYCIMAATDYNDPQPLNMYYKSKLGWAELEEINGNEKTNPILKTDAKAIKFGVKGSEFFIAQYWPANNYNRYSSDGNTYSKEAGVIIYRVNSAITTGNMGDRDKNHPNPKKLDEIYILRTGPDSGASYDFPAVLKNADILKNLTYSDGSSANLIIKIAIDINNFNITVESYIVEFKVKNATTNMWEIVPYEIAINLTGKSKEKTFGGTYVFSFEEDYNSGKKISFECYGYKFYLDPAHITGGLESISEIPLSDTPYYKLDEKNLKITIYAVATPRDLNLNFKDFEGNILSFNLSDIDYALCEHDGTLQNNETGTLQLTNFSGKFFGDNQVKNGDFIYFILDGYRTEILEITPEVKPEKTENINLAKLCAIAGIVSSKGTPLKDVKISIKDYIVISTAGNKYSFEFITFIIYSDQNGFFELNNIPQGSDISFELENYEIQNHMVTHDNIDLSINLVNSSDSSLIVIIIAAVIIAIITIATLISVLATRKRPSYNTNEHYEE